MIVAFDIIKYSKTGLWTECDGRFRTITINDFEEGLPYHVEAIIHWSDVWEMAEDDLFLLGIKYPNLDYDIIKEPLCS